MQYRADIDGLRAIAVISVVMFHAFPEILSGGYVGVDIFFVISGYLITQLILEGISTGNFSLIGFYGRRVRRIFPALILVLLISLILGWYLITSELFSELGKHVFSSSIFLVNFTYVSELNYFDNLAFEKPLLHLWSLAVEEQFYIFWPILIYLFSKSRNFLFPFFGIFLFSIIFNLYFSNIEPDANFFLPFGRFWELMVGGFLAYIKKDAIKINFIKAKEGYKNTFSFLGISLILIGIIIFDKVVQYPSYFALLPVIGTAMLIYSGRDSLINKHILSNRIFVYIGLISYPLYLWHWPILSIMYIAKGETLHRDTKVGAIVISFFLAILTYKYVENFFRKKDVGFNFKILPILMIIVGSFGLLVHANNGFTNRPILQISDLNKKFEKFPYEKNLDCGLEEFRAKVTQVCKKDSREEPIYALVGDSKAEVLINGLMRTSYENRRWLIIGGNMGYGGPAPFLSDLPRFSKYQGFIKPAIEAINKNSNIRVVAIAGSGRTLGNFSKSSNWLRALDADGYDEGGEALRRVVQKFIERKKHVILIVDNLGLGNHKSCTKRELDIPLYGKYTLDIADDCELSINQYLELRSKYIKALKKIARDYEGKVTIFDTYEDVCDLSINKCMRTIDGKSTFSYSDHISDYVAGKIGLRLNSLLKDKFK